MSEGFIRKCHFPKWGGGTVCSHVKIWKICRISFQDLVSGEIMKLTRWLSAPACFTVVLLVDTGFSLLVRLQLIIWQDAEEGKNDGTVQGERRLLHDIFFALGDQHVLCVKTCCNYGKWRAMKPNLEIR